MTLKEDGAASRWRKGAGMLSDLAALTPPLVVAVAFMIGIVLFLRRQLGQGAGGDDGAETEISADTGNADRDAQPPAASADQRNV
jgi:hypothetical protein